MIVEIPPEILEEIVKVGETLNQEPCQYGIAEQIDDFHRPHVVERIMEETIEVVRLFPQDCLQERIVQVGYVILHEPCFERLVEQSADNHLPQRMEEIVEVKMCDKSGRILQRTVEQHFRALVHIFPQNVVFLIG